MTLASHRAQALSDRAGRETRHHEQFADPRHDLPFLPRPLRKRQRLRPLRPRSARMIPHPPKPRTIAPPRPRGFPIPTPTPYQPRTHPPPSRSRHPQLTQYTDRVVSRCRAVTSSCMLDCLTGGMPCQPSMSRPCPVAPNPKPIQHFCLAQTLEAWRLAWMTPTQPHREPPCARYCRLRQSWTDRRSVPRTDRSWFHRPIAPGSIEPRQDPIQGMLGLSQVQNLRQGSLWRRLGKHSSKDWFQGFPEQGRKLIAVAPGSLGGFSDRGSCQH